MTLVVDIGNTNIVCGVYRREALIWHARFKTDRTRTSDEYYSLLISLKANKWGFDQITKVAIASVVPDLTRMWQHLIHKYTSLDSIIINGYSQLGLTFRISDPGFIGSDLIVNALAAWKKYQSTCIIIDFGTATTIQIVSREGFFLGAVISPGLRTAAAELFDKAALLSEIELQTPDVILGVNTTEALLSGIIKGHALMVEGFVVDLKKEFADYAPFKVIATGGVTDLISPLVSHIDYVDKTLTLDGLNLAVNLLYRD